MTTAELQTKRNEILQSLGIAKTQFGEWSTQYHDQERALAIIDAELVAVSGTTTVSRTSVASHSRD